MQPDRIHWDKSTPSPPTRGKEKKWSAIKRSVSKALSPRLQESKQGQLATAEHDTGCFPGWWAGLPHITAPQQGFAAGRWSLCQDTSQHGLWTHNWLGPFFLFLVILSMKEALPWVDLYLRAGDNWQVLRAESAGDLWALETYSVWSWSPSGIRYSFFWQDD